MRILHVLTSDLFSGAENVVCQIISMMKDFPDIEMFYTSPDGDIKDTLNSLNVSFLPMKQFSFSELKKIIKNNSPDIIHAHDMRASFYVACICKKIPLISHIHNNSFDSRIASIKSIAYFFAAKKAKKIFWVSQSAFDGYVFNKSIERKSIVLHNIIDIDQLVEKSLSISVDKTYDVVYLGRLSYPKNPERLIEVFRQVISLRGNTRFAIIGTGELDEKIRGLICEYSLSNYIDMVGFMSNPYGILKKSKVMIMTSRWEGTPMCALEAMILGVPIVATPVDGLKDLVANGENGYLCSDNEDLAMRIVEILDNTNLAREMKINQQKKANQYNDKEKYIRELLSVYYDALN